MAAVAVIARTTLIFAALIAEKFTAAVAVSLLSCKCCGSDTSDVATFTRIIVNSCCCLASEDNCWL